MTETTNASTDASPTPEPIRVDLGRVFSGLAMIAIGLLVWLQLEEGLALVDLITYWPILLVVGGISGMLSERAWSGGGWVVPAIGVGLLLHNLGYAPWPVLLVGIGIVMALRGLREGSRIAATGGRHG